MQGHIASGAMIFIWVSINIPAPAPDVSILVLQGSGLPVLDYCIEQDILSTF